MTREGEKIELEKVFENLNLDWGCSLKEIIEKYRNIRSQINFSSELNIEKKSTELNKLKLALKDLETIRNYIKNNSFITIDGLLKCYPDHVELSSFDIFLDHEDNFINFHEEILKTEEKILDLTKQKEREEKKSRLYHSNWEQTYNDLCKQEQKNIELERNILFLKEEKKNLERKLCVKEEKNKEIDKDRQESDKKNKEILEQNKRILESRIDKGEKEIIAFRSNVCGLEGQIETLKQKIKYFKSESEEWRKTAFCFERQLVEKIKEGFNFQEEKKDANNNYLSDNCNKNRISISIGKDCWSQELEDLSDLLLVLMKSNQNFDQPQRLIESLVEVVKLVFKGNTDSMRSFLNIINYECDVDESNNLKHSLFNQLRENSETKLKEMNFRLSEEVKKEKEQKEKIEKENKELKDRLQIQKDQLTMQKNQLMVKEEQMAENRKQFIKISNNFNESRINLAASQKKLDFIAKQIKVKKNHELNFQVGRMSDTEFNNLEKQASDLFLQIQDEYDEGIFRKLLFFLDSLKSEVQIRSDELALRTECLSREFEIEKQGYDDEKNILDSWEKSVKTTQLVNINENKRNLESKKKELDKKLWQINECIEQANKIEECNNATKADDERFNCLPYYIFVLFIFVVLVLYKLISKKK